MKQARKAGRKTRDGKEMNDSKMEQNIRKEKET